jgi:hypothetical protein
VTHAWSGDVAGTVTINGVTTVNEGSYGLNGWTYATNASAAIVTR